MLTSIKRLLAFLILAGLVFDPVAGTFTWLQYKKSAVKQEVRKQIEEGMDSDKLILLKFSKEETRTKLRWEHSREFEYERKMYDVVRTKTVGDSVYFWCWYDHEETMLNRRMEELASKAAEGHSKTQQEIVPLISCSESLYCIFSEDLTISLLDNLDKPLNLSSYLYSQILFQPPTPPPQFS